MFFIKGQTHSVGHVVSVTAPFGHCSAEAATEKREKSECICVPTKLYGHCNSHMSGNIYSSFVFFSTI